MNEVITELFIILSGKRDTLRTQNERENLNPIHRQDNEREIEKIDKALESLRELK